MNNPHLQNKHYTNEQAKTYVGLAHNITYIYTSVQNAISASSAHAIVHAVDAAHAQIKNLKKNKPKNSNKKCLGNPPRQLVFLSYKQ